MSGLAYEEIESESDSDLWNSMIVLTQQQAAAIKGTNAEKLYE